MYTVHWNILVPAGEFTPGKPFNAGVGRIYCCRVSHHRACAKAELGRDGATLVPSIVDKLTELEWRVIS